jgi:hypothetical protein
MEIEMKDQENSEIEEEEEKKEDMPEEKAMITKKNQNQNEINPQNDKNEKGGQNCA